MKFYRGWPIIWEAYSQARNKKHGRGKAPLYQALVLGLMQRAIAIQQPMPLSLYLVWGFRFHIATYWRSHDQR